MIAAKESSLITTCDCRLLRKSYALKSVQVRGSHVSHTHFFLLIWQHDFFCAVHGTSDKVIPIDDAYKFAAAIKQHRLCIIDGADHNFRRPEHVRQMIDAVVEHCCH